MSNYSPFYSPAKYLPFLFLEIACRIILIFFEVPIIQKIIPAYSAHHA